MSPFISKWCQIHNADIVCRAHISVQYTECPALSFSSDWCPCIMCQHSIQCVPGCTSVAQKNSCMLLYFVEQVILMVSYEIVLKVNFSNPQSALINKKHISWNKHVTRISWSDQTLKAFLTYTHKKLLKTIRILPMYYSFSHTAFSCIMSRQQYNCFSSNMTNRLVTFKNKHSWNVKTSHKLPFVLQLIALSLFNKTQACLNGRTVLSFTLSDLLRKGAHV